MLIHPHPSPQHGFYGPGTSVGRSGPSTLRINFTGPSFGWVRPRLLSTAWTVGFEQSTVVALRSMIGIHVNSLHMGKRTVAGKTEYAADQRFRVYNMFSMAHSKPHSARKRMVSNVYSKSVLQSSDEVAAVSREVLYHRFLPILQDAAVNGKPVEMWSLINAVTMDMTACYLFGLAIGPNFIQNPAYRDHWLDLYHSRRGDGQVSYDFWPSEMPRTTSFLEKIRASPIPEWVDSKNTEIKAWCMDMCEASNQHLLKHPSAEQVPAGRDPSVYRQLITSFVKQAGGTKADVSTLSHEDKLGAASEMMDHTAAGHETSAVALTYLFWELSQHPKLQEQLRQELLSLKLPILFPSVNDKHSPEFHPFPESLPSTKDLDSLPILHAIVMETLRLHSPIPGPQPRITPSQPATLAGYSSLPPNIRVSAQAYSLHRNPDVFPDPESWKPERWLQPSDKQEEMKRWFWAFGSGGRMCVGSNLAMQSTYPPKESCDAVAPVGALTKHVVTAGMKSIISAIYTNYKTTIIDDTGIEQEDAYTACPVAKRLVLKFEHA